MKKTRHEVGTMLLVLILLCSIAAAESNDPAAKKLRSTHINVDGNQDVIEKAFRPGTQGADNLSHARRSTIYIGAVRSPKQELGIGYHRTKEILFTTQASAFLYAYPTPKSKTTMEAQEDGDGSRRESTEHGVWIVTCKHAVEDSPFIGVRLNTTTGSSLTYVTTGASWKRDEQADVAVLKFKGWRKPDVDLAMFEYSQAVAKEKIVSHALYEGTPIALTGYPVSMLRTRDRNYPVVQFGYIAQIQGYLAGDQNHAVFLIGGAAFPGNSGGPVLVPGGTPTAVTRYYRRGLLLGMVCAQRLAPTRTDKGWNYAVRQSAYLAKVVPMAAIHKAIEQSGVWEVQAQ